MGDQLRGGRAFVLLAADPVHLPAELAAVCNQLDVHVVAEPTSAADQDDWDDVLDAVALAMRHFPDDPGVAEHDDLASDILPPATSPAMPRVDDASDIARELAVGMTVLDEAGAHVGQLTTLDGDQQVMKVAPHLFAQHVLAIPYAVAASVDPESMTVRLMLPKDTVQARFASPQHDSSFV